MGNISLKVLNSLTFGIEYIEEKIRFKIVLFTESLDEIIDPAHEVRLIDLFVESLDLKNLNFKIGKI